MPAAASATAEQCLPGRQDKIHLHTYNKHLLRVLAIRLFGGNPRNLVYNHLLYRREQTRLVMMCRGVRSSRGSQLVGEPPVTSTSSLFDACRKLATHLPAHSTQTVGSVPNRASVSYNESTTVGGSRWCVYSLWQRWAVARRKETRTILQHTIGAHYK